MGPPPSSRHANRPFISPYTVLIQMKSKSAKKSNKQFTRMDSASSTKKIIPKQNQRRMEQGGHKGHIRPTIGHNTCRIIIVPLIVHNTCRIIIVPILQDLSLLCNIPERYKPYYQNLIIKTRGGDRFPR